MSEEDILTDEKGKALYITLNRPKKLNSMTLGMLEKISKALTDAEKDQNIRCVVITGAGDRSFCAGADVSYFSGLSSEEGEEFSKKGHKTFMKILNLNKPVVAAVNGYALGGGCELAAYCDIRIASEKARFGQPEINLGLIPGWGGTQILPLLIGFNRAKQLLMSGNNIPAEEARAIGLVNEVIPAELFREKIDEFVQELTSQAPLALTAMKELINRNMRLTDGLEDEAKEFGKLFASEDLAEGLLAFTEKRKPKFKGK